MAGFVSPLIRCLHVNWEQAALLLVPGEKQVPAACFVLVPFRFCVKMG